jgi:hypothetical protein
MTEYNEAQVWSAIHGIEHPHLRGNEMTIEGYMPLIDTLFPGINYFSMTGFGQVMQNYVRPSLTKLFPAVVEKKAHQVDRDRTLTVDALLPSEGYEHQDNPEWKEKLDTILEAM